MNISVLLIKNNHKYKLLLKFRMWVHEARVHLTGLILSLDNYGRRFVTLNRSSDQDHPQEKEIQKAKWLSEEDLQISEKRREAKGKGERER